MIKILTEAVRMNAREQMQKAISHWVKVVKELEYELNNTERHTKEWEATARAQREYKGRIYAARQFGDILGYEFDTNLI